MASIVDYMVISDGSFALNPGESKTFGLPVPANYVEGTHRARPILAFKVWATPSGGSFEVEVNDTEVYRSTVSGGDVRGLWEIFSGTILRPGTDNTVQFRSTENKIWYSDVVLWFQVQV
jgi:hypothetical protein